MRQIGRRLATVMALGTGRDTPLTRYHCSLERTQKKRKHIPSEGETDKEEDGLWKGDQGKTFVGTVEG